MLFLKTIFFRRLGYKNYFFCGFFRFFLRSWGVVVGLPSRRSALGLPFPRFCALALPPRYTLRQTLRTKQI